MKLLVVDDEQIEREGMLAILRKGFPDAELAQAKNGKAAVELVAEYRPDLVLMDIKMPGMSGLEAVERISAQYPETKFIMVTAYDTFDYALQAIKLGVKDYLLKPSKAAEITETVGKALREIQMEREARQSSIRDRNTVEKMMPVVEADIVTQLLFDHVHEVHLDEMVSLLGRQTTKEAFVLVIDLRQAPSPESYYAAVKEKLRQLGNGWVGAMSCRHIPLVVFLEEGKSYRAQAASMARQLLDLAERAPQTECFIGIGSAYSSLDRIRYSYREALLALSEHALPARHRFYEDVPSAAEWLSSDFPGKEKEMQLLDHVRLGQWERVRETVKLTIERLETAGTELNLAQQRVLETVWLISRLLTDMGVETEPPYFSFRIGDFRQLRAEADGLIGKLQQAAERHRSRVEPDVVQKVKMYILEFSHLDLSLEAIAEQVGLSPFYLSKLFKEQLGVNYIDFLTECRVERAKTMMADPKLSLKEIAYAVGYRDPNYFSKVFRKMCGVPPTDYRKQLLGRKG